VKIDFIKITYFCIKLFMRIVFGPKEDAIWSNNILYIDDKCVTIIRCFHVNNS